MCNLIVKKLHQLIVKKLHQKEHLVCESDLSFLSYVFMLYLETDYPIDGEQKQNIVSSYMSNKEREIDLKSVQMK